MGSPPPPPPPPSSATVDGDVVSMARPTARRESSSQQSESSQTAAEFLRDQMQLEADAREALPYSIENCTNPLGPLRQSVFACLTCNPPPANASDPYQAAGVCYSCSVQCHGEHNLVEIFNKRDFTCDCGTTRLPATSPCSLRINTETKSKGGVHSEAPNPNNKYNQNFRNRFCGCECDYDPFEQKGTMFQCLGLGNHETGGCGEDWWHPGCIVGLGPKWFEAMEKNKEEGPKPAMAEATNGSADAPAAQSTLQTATEDLLAQRPSSDTTLPTISEDAQDQQLMAAQVAENLELEDDDPPMPPGFPTEDSFDGFICYKCVETNPWIKQYAGTPGFLPAVFFQKGEVVSTPVDVMIEAPAEQVSKKRKADDEEMDGDSQESKRMRSNEEPSQEIAKAERAEPTESAPATTELPCKLKSLRPAPKGQMSLFFADSFRDALCRCSACYPLLEPHPQLLEEEETYEPPVSEDGSENGASTHGNGSIYERGESALNNLDRVRAIEGVMAYEHLKDKLTPFFKRFADSGEAITAVDIKEYFAKLRGDEQAIKEAGDGAQSDFRQEQSGY